MSAGDWHKRRLLYLETKQFPDEKRLTLVVDQYFDVVYLADLFYSSCDLVKLVIVHLQAFQKFFIGLQNIDKAFGIRYEISDFATLERCPEKDDAFDNAPSILHEEVLLVQVDFVVLPFPKSQDEGLLSGLVLEKIEAVESHTLQTTSPPKL